jgi:hypothetical protein
MLSRKFFRAGTRRARGLYQFRNDATAKKGGELLYCAQSRTSMVAFR